MLHPEMTADLATHLAAEGSEGVPARSYRRDGVHGRLVHDLGRRIVSGEFAPGDLLPTETALVSELGSGRSAVREAVKVLTAKGLVRTRTKTGTVVLPEATWNLLDPDVLAWRYQTAPTGQQLDDLAGLRVALEPEAARLAARAARQGRDRTDQGRRTSGWPRRSATRTRSSGTTWLSTGPSWPRAATCCWPSYPTCCTPALAAARQVHTRNVRRNKRSLIAHQEVLDAITSHDAERAGRADAQAGHRRPARHPPRHGTGNA